LLAATVSPRKDPVIPDPSESWHLGRVEVARAFAPKAAEVDFCVVAEVNLYVVSIYPNTPSGKW
jgi:hypothetical protein